MNTSNENKPISVQVSRYLSGEMDDAEEIAFREQIKTDADMQAEVDSLAPIWEMTDPEKLHDPASVDTNKAWRHLSARISADKEHKNMQHEKTFGFPDWMKWAAVWFTAMVMSFTAYHLFRPEDPEPLISFSNPDSNVTFARFLNDGSIVYLSGNSEVSLGNDFAKNNRDVSLSGEAFFDVARDQDQPFTLNTGLVSIEVVGTSFYVNARKDDVLEIYLQTGAVRAMVRSSGETILLKPGDFLSVDKEQVQKTALNGWQVPLLGKPLHFHDEPFENILMVLSRKYNVGFTASEYLHERSMTLTLYGSSIETISEAVALSLGVEYEIKEDNRVEFR